MDDSFKLQLVQFSAVGLQLSNCFSQLKEYEYIHQLK